MILPPALLNKLQSEEELEEVMAQATIITAAISGQTVTATTAGQAMVVEGQLFHHQNKKKGKQQHRRQKLQTISLYNMS
jgi:hypothetical protein